MPTKVRMEMRTREASFVPDSVDKERRTVRLVWSTGARAPAYDWDTGPFEEELGMEPGQVRLERLNNGAPLLDSHNRWNLREGVMGVIERGWLQDGQGFAVARFSKRDDVEPIWQDVVGGIIRNVSVGYKVYRYEERPPGPDGRRVRRAVDWEPREVSLVAVQADPGASVRAGFGVATGYQPPGLDLYECVVVTEKERTMPPQDPAQPTPPTPTPTPPPAPLAARADPVQPQAPATPASPAQGPDARAAVELERARGIEIRALTRKMRLEDAVADDLVKRGLTLDEARREAIDKWEGLQPEAPRPQLTLVRDEHEGSFRAMEEALLHRHDPVKYKLPEDSRAREYRGLSLIELAREALQLRGQFHRGRSKMEVAGEALRQRSVSGGLTTSDFPNVLANVANKTLRDAYQEAPATFVGTLARRTTIADFKPVKRVALGAAPNLTKLNQAGEYTYGVVGEGAESYALASYGKIIPINRQVVVNDDLQAFTRLPGLMGAAARRMESDVVWGVITANAAMADGVALFHANHVNLGDKVLALAGLDQLSVLIRRQTGLAGERLNLEPAYVYVPPQLETTARQLLVQTTQPVTDGATNPFKGRLTLVVEARLDGSALIWFMSCATGQIDIVEYAYLEGEEGPIVETRLGWEVDGVEIKVREDFAAAAIDFRGIAKSSGTV